MENKSIYEHIADYKKKYPYTIAWRTNKHAKLIETYLNPNEKIEYAFAAQKSEDWANIISSCVFAITNKRILIAKKRLLIGHSLVSITLDMFNDITVSTGIFFGKVHIDTVREQVTLSKIQKNSLDEIETHLSECLLKDPTKTKKSSHEKA